MDKAVHVHGEDYKKVRVRVRVHVHGEDYKRAPQAKSGIAPLRCP
jgi:hypothetical protein